MHYCPQTEECPLALNPFKACVAPRPIGWISTVSRDGVANLAPFSQFQNLSYDPMLDCMWITVYGPDKSYQVKDFLFKVKIDISGYTEKYKISTPYGFQPLDNGLYYLSEHRGKYPHCDGLAHLYRYTGNGFELVND